MANHYRETAQQAVEKIKREYLIDDEAGLFLLENLVDIMAHEMEASAIIEQDGLCIVDRFDQKKEHPLCKVLRDCRSQKLQTLKALGLEQETNDGPGRPPGY